MKRPAESGRFDLLKILAVCRTVLSFQDLQQVIGARNMGIASYPHLDAPSSHTKIRLITSSSVM